MDIAKITKRRPFTPDKDDTSFPMPKRPKMVHTSPQSSKTSEIPAVKKKGRGRPPKKAKQNVDSCEENTKHPVAHSSPLPSEPRVMLTPSDKKRADKKLFDSDRKPCEDEKMDTFEQKKSSELAQTSGESSASPESGKADKQGSGKTPASAAKDRETEAAAEDKDEKSEEKSSKKLVSQKSPEKSPKKQVEDSSVKSPSKSPKKAADKSSDTSPDVHADQNSDKEVTKSLQKDLHVTSATETPSEILARKLSKELDSESKGGTKKEELSTLKDFVSMNFDWLEECVF